MPDWNPDDVRGSFEAFAVSIHEQAREVFLRDKTHVPMFFFMPLDGKGTMMIQAHKDKDKMTASVRAYIQRYNIYGVVYVAESWIYLKTGPGDHIHTQLMLGEMRVSDLRPEHRREALLVAAEARDGFSRTWVDEILRDKRAVSLAPTVEYKDLQGRFGNLFR